MGTARRLGSQGDGPPVYAYEAVPGVLPVSAVRLGRELSPGGLPQAAHSHAHDFLVLVYFERGGSSTSNESHPLLGGPHRAR